MPDRVFKVGDSVGTIPEDSVNSFLAKYPDAIEMATYKIGSDTGYIPLVNMGEFEQKYPDATLLNPKSFIDYNRYPNSEIEIKTNLESGEPERIKNAVSSLAKSFMSGFGNLSKSIAILAKKINIGGEYDGIPVEELATYKFGQSIQDLAEEYFPTDQRLQKEFFSTTLPSAFGSMAFYMLGGMSARALKLGAIGTNTISGLLGAMDAGASGFDEAKAAGASDEVAFRAYLENMGWGATEAIPIGRIFKKLDNLSSGIMKQMISKYSTRKLLVEGAKNGLEEMLQEFGQQIGQNWSAQRLYDFNRELLDGSIDGGIAGFITGATMASLGMKMRERKLKKTGLTESDIKLLDKAIENNEKFLKNQTKAILSPKEVIAAIAKEDHEVQNTVDQALEDAARGSDAYYEEAPPYEDWMYEQGIDQADYDQSITSEQVNEILDQGITAAAGLDALQSMNEMNLAGETNLDEVQGITNSERIESLADLNIEPNITLEEVQDLGQAQSLESNLYESTPKEVNPLESSPTTQNQELSGQVENKEVNGINISSYESGLGKKLSNFYNIPVEFNGKKYNSSEQAYQDNKKNLENLSDENVLKLMVDVISAKLNQHPELINEIDKNGGINFLDKSSHNLIKNGNTVKQDRWTGQNGLFMQALKTAYNLIKGEQNGLQTKETKEEVKKELNSTKFYHGTTAELNDGKPFYEFNTTAYHDKGDFGAGYYFTTDKEYAASHGKHMYEVSLSGNNIFVGTAKEYFSLPVEEQLSFDTVAITETGKIKDAIEVIVRNNKQIKINKINNLEIKKEQTNNVTSQAIVNTKIDDGESISNEEITKLNDPEDENGKESIENEPIYGSNHIVNELLKNKVITKDKIAETAASISTLAKNSKTINDFEIAIVKKYGDILPSELVAKVFLRENTLEAMNVYDVDVTLGSDNSTAIVSESNFIDANNKDLSNRYLLNEVLRPYLKDLAIIKLYSNDSSQNRTGSLTTRNLNKKDLYLVSYKLMQKGLALLPLSDSDTVLAVKINNKYLKQQNESTQDHGKRLTELIKKNYPEVNAADISKNTADLVIDLTRADFLSKTLKYWYTADRQANDVAKRFKLFLPKGVELKFKRKLNAQIIPDIELKDKNGNTILKSDGTPFVVTDGTTFGNPQTYREFTEYNQLGDIKQHKTIITQSDGDKTVAIKHMTHVLPVKEWNYLAEQLGFDKNIDLVAFDSAAKLANNKDGRLKYSTTFEINPESVRHIFSGQEHLIATFSRQIFNFTGVNPEVTKHIIDNVIKPVFDKIHQKFELLETNPQALKTELGRLIGEVEEGLSDYRRYLKLDAYHYKTLRSNIRKLLKNKYIIDGYIKLRQKGGVAYLMPDYRNVLKRGEAMIPYVQYRRIAELAKSKGYTGNSIKELNDWLADNEIKLLTYRPPIPKPDNIQTLRVKAILPGSFGSAIVMNTQDVVLNKEGDMDGDEIFFHYFENESDVKYISDQIAQSHRNVGEISLGKGESGSAFNHNNMLTTGYMAGLGKKAVGEVAKASTVRAILESNNVRIGEFASTEGNYYLIITKDNEKNAIKIYNLRKDWKDFDRKIAYTLQASVDNLKQFALVSGTEWNVDKDGFVSYNLKKLYAEMFPGMSTDGVQALKIIRNALNVFSKDFESGGQYTQEKMNEIAWQYKAYVDFSNGALGNSPHEKMIMDIANLGFLPRFVHYDYLSNTFTPMDGPKEQFINDIHDKAHSEAVGEIKKEIVDGKTPTANISTEKRQQIQGAVKALYNEYKRLSDSKTSSGKDFIELFDRFRNNFKSKLHEHEIVYCDFLTFMGYYSKKDESGKYNVTKNNNSRFILNVMDDANIKKFTQIFNKHYEEMLDKGKSSLDFTGIWDTIQQPTTLGLGGGFSNNSQVKFNLDLAIVRFFKNYHLGMQYSKDDKTPYDDAVKLVDRINRELYEIGKLPFSDVVDMKVLYRDVLEQRGKKLDSSTKLTAADGYAMLLDLKQLRHNLRTGKVNSFSRYLYFTEDILIKNPYTTGVIKAIKKITNYKDADTWKFTSVISNIEQNDQIRELLDLKTSKKTDISRMHAAEYVLSLHTSLQKAIILDDKKKANKIKKEIKELLDRDSTLKEQVAIVNDVVLALDGSLGKKGEQEQYYRSQLLNKHGENVVKAFDKARKLLDDIIEYDIQTWNDEIGPHDSEYYEVEKDGITYRVKSKQYFWIQKLKQRLKDSGWKDDKIRQLLNRVIVKKPQRRDNYYPHNYFGMYVSKNNDDVVDTSFLNNFDSMTDEEMNVTAKGIMNWNQRTADNQSLDSMADRNLFRVLTRRANTSVNARYTNRFRSLFELMTTRINDGLKDLSNKGDVNGLNQLIEVRAVAQSMYDDMTRMPEFSWAKSMVNILKGLYVSNLLLLSTKGNLRNLTQGIFPNFIEFSDGYYSKGVNLSKNNDYIKFSDGSEHNIFDSLGIARADIFAKVEGGQEWDVYQSYRDILELQSAEGRSAKAKVLAKQYMQAVEARMNKFVKIAGENNIFMLTSAIGEKLWAKATNKLTGKFVVPDVKPRKFSFSMIEKNNRRRTAAMAFLQKWEDLQGAQMEQRKGMSVEQLTKLDKRNYDIALKYASDMIDKIQFNYNAWNRPAGIRGPVKSTLFQFKSFSLGMVKLHWNWIFDVAMNPYKEWKKLAYFSLVSLITGGITKAFDKDFWRFFEIPEYEYFAGFFDWMFGNSKERKWAFYGNKLTPVSGPIGGMVFEAIIGSQFANDFIDAGYLDTFVDRGFQEEVGKFSGLYTRSNSRRKIAIQRLVESHVPFLKEYDDLYKNFYSAYLGRIGFDKAISNYIGLYDIYEPKGVPNPPNPLEKRVKWLPEETYDLLRKSINRFTR